MCGSCTRAAEPLLYDSQNHSVTLLAVVLGASAFLSLELMSDHQLHVHWNRIRSILFQAHDETNVTFANSFLIIFLTFANYL